MRTKLAGPSRPPGLVTRLLEQPGLVRLVRGLDAPVLSRLIRHIGLEDAGEIVALATAEQLEGVFDEDLWQGGRPGEGESFDAERFALWLEIMLEAGESFAAKRLAELDEDLVTVGLCKNVLVVDIDALGARMSHSRRRDNDLIEKALDSCLYQEFEEFRVIAKNHRGFDAIVAVLAELDRERHDLLRALLGRCCAISSDYVEDSGGLYDVLTSEETLEADVSADREGRRERDGFVAPSTAASFLNLSRITPLDEALEATAYDAVTRAHFRAAEPPSPEPPPPDGAAGRLAPAEGAHDFFEALREAGVLRGGAPQLLDASGGAEGVGLAFASAVRALKAHDPETYATRLTELSYLVNVLIAGCGREGRPFRPFEAAEAALCACNLGLERLLEGPAARKKQGRGTPLSAAIEHSAVKMFTIGWHIVHNDVVLFAAGAMAAVLARRGAEQADPQTARQLERAALALKADADAGKPWRSRGRLARLEGELGADALAACLALIDECPTLPQGLSTGSGRHSHFIATASQVRAIRASLAAPEVVDAKAEGRPPNPAPKPRRRQARPGRP